MTGDFNNDGKTDLAYLAEDTNKSIIEVLMRNATNTGFDKVDVEQVGNAISVGDFNGDGKDDLVINGYENISVLLRNATNTGFDAKVDYKFDYYYDNNTPVLLKSGDFNNDGKDDLAISSLYSGGFSVLLRNATNTGFDATIDYNTKDNNTSFNVGDFNNDGKDDLAICGGGVSVLLRNADNTGFDAGVTYKTSYNPVSVGIGDFNNDGKTDLATPDSNDRAVSVLLNTLHQ